MLSGAVRRLIKRGRLVILNADGSATAFGDGDPALPDVVVRLTDRAVSTKLALWPDLYLGEAYMSGQLVIEQGTLWNLLELCGLNVEMQPRHRRNVLLHLARWAGRHIQQHNAVRNSRKNVAHHYDLSHDLYRTFLDPDLQYSCAYFSSPGASLDQAQVDKKRHIASKLLLEPGQRILDIGCGWGGLALALARAEKVDVLGITLSNEQLEVARRRAAAEGLQGRVRFELCDYRSVRGKFDRIVSVGMFEHVGAPYYGTFFEQLAGLLAESGIALLHSIGRMRGPNVTSAWVRKYIFPGGYIPAISEVVPAVENAGLWLTDLEILRLHYAETLRAWRERFLLHAEEIERLYDPTFRRMWEFYLAVSEMSFRYGGMMVFQAQLATKIDSVPMTRDYMWENEGRYRLSMAAE